MIISRRDAGLAALGAMVSIADAQAQTAPPPPEPYHARELPITGPREKIAMLIYPGFTALDLIGPQYAFASMVGADVKLVAKSLAPVRSDTGVVFIPDATLSDVPEDLDILFTPGGLRGTLDAMGDAETIAFMKSRGNRAKLVTSVCTGSLVLGAAGLLDGYRATSHWLTHDLLPLFGAEPIKERVVIDRNRITGGGVTAGIDFGLRIVAMLRGESYAQAVQLLAEYTPDPPFPGSGDPLTAPPDAKALIDRIMVPFRRDARLAAERSTRR
jgi:cyclohexyl-isocyanide hydratase